MHLGRDYLPTADLRRYAEIAAIENAGNSGILWEIHPEGTDMADRLLPRAEVEARCGIARTTIYRLMRAGEFPTPIKVGLRAVRWRESELEAFLADRPRATGDGPRAAA